MGAKQTMNKQQQNYIRFSTDSDMLTSSKIPGDIQYPRYWYLMLDLSTSGERGW